MCYKIISSTMVPILRLDCSCCSETHYVKFYFYNYCEEDQSYYIRYVNNDISFKNRIRDVVQYYKNRNKPESADLDGVLFNFHQLKELYETLIDHAKKIKLFSKDELLKIKQGEVFNTRDLTLFTDLNEQEKIFFETEELAFSMDAIKKEDSYHVYDFFVRWKMPKNEKMLSRALHYIFKNYGTYFNRFETFISKEETIKMLSVMTTLFKRLKADNKAIIYED